MIKTTEITSQMDSMFSEMKAIFSKLSTADFSKLSKEERKEIYQELDNLEQEILAAKKDLK